MTGQGLADLDELVLRCRDQRARSYIAEAVACYKAGAFRACIVATWIALVFDLLDKFRELELAGNRKAKQELEKLDQHKSNRDYQALLAFERGILDLARDGFQLLSPEEYDDLARLRDDRNRCAHPSMQSTGEPYEATAELARYHLRNAVTHLLAQPPVQGKFALDRIWRVIRSDYFPIDVEEAIEELRSGPLARARPALVRSVVIGLTKDLLLEDRDKAERRRQFTALLAVQSMHRETSEAVLRDDLPRIFEGMDDDDLGCVILFVRRVPFGWDALTEPNRNKLRQFVSACPSEEAATVVPPALRVPALADVARTRLEDLPDDALARLLRGEPYPEVIKLAMARFVDSNSFSTARTRSRTLLIPAAPMLTAEQVKEALRAFVDNRQIKQSTGVTDILEQLLEQTKTHARAARHEWQMVREVLIEDPFFEGEEDDLINLINETIADS